MTGTPVSEKCSGVEDLSKRTLRELLTLARARLGSAAAGLKTRDEILSALSGEARPPEAPPAPPPPAPVVAEPVITRDFFHRQGSS